MTESPLSPEDQRTSCSHLYPLAGWLENPILGLSEEIQIRDSVLTSLVPGKTREEYTRNIRELSTPEVMSGVASIIRGIGDICAQQM